MIVALAQGFIALAADTEGWVGTWLSEAEGVTNVTTLMPDGRFRTEHLAGIQVVGVTSGRWELRSKAIRWSYDAPQSALPVDDVNAVVLKAPDRFVVRELSGSESSFFLKGTVDPKAPPDLPVAVGAGWVLKDELGEFAIRVTARETVGGRDCYRVDWIQGGRAYQSEYWFMDSEGIRVAGRRVLGVQAEFATPYLLVKRVLTPGDEWDASITVRGREVRATVSVGQRGEVVTAAGTFQAVPVTLQSDALHYVRWYTKDVGLVREDVLVGGQLHNTKTLQRRLE
jgi:hypothetical protein